jgi:hypothetical protein
VAGSWPCIFILCRLPQSKESDDRKEEKLDFVIQKLDPENYKT